MAEKLHSNTTNSKKYDSYSREDLIARIKELENSAPLQISKSETRSLKRKRPFIWENVSKRHVLLKFFYFGWEYQGYVSQVHTLETVEEHLMTALKTSCLIENREKSNYHRCGRTDAGVTAFSQIISIDLRSKLKEPSEDNVEEELQYCQMLNRLLPIYIRCYAWCHIGAEVSARFDCTSRTYNYFFPRGSFDIAAMEKGAQHLEGTHDFRNLCKMDVANGVVEFVRSITSVSISLHKSDPLPEFEIMKFSITSRAFLWHQIRCIMAVLFLVGEGKEDASIVAELLDISGHPCKPQYHMAVGLPLALTATLYENHETKWVSSEEEVNILLGQLQELWTEFAVKECMIREAFNLVKNLRPCNPSWKKQSYLYTGIVAKNYVPLFKRPTCSSLEDRIVHIQTKKRRIQEMQDKGINKETF